MDDMNCQPNVKLEASAPSGTNNGSAAPSITHSKKPRKRMSRSQRRKAKQNQQNQQNQGNAKAVDTREDTRVIIKENENLVNYYREQKFFKDENTFDQFLASLRAPLPASFRINTFDYRQGQLLRQLVEKQFQVFLETKEEDSTFTEDAMQKDVKPTTDQNSSQSTNADECVPTLECLDWYPKKMAWQMNVTRIDFRKSSILRSLHKFIQAETDNGFVSRQEAVSMIPPLVLDVRRGQNILDMCAAPGSKTAQLLEYLAFDIHGAGENAAKGTTDQSSVQATFNAGLVVANDVDNKRCYMLVHQASRLNSPNCVIINEDAARIPKMNTFDASGKELVRLKFDRILCDAPCTGDGTLRKNPDGWRKWNVANANNMHGLQSKILKRGVELLSENGIIVYSTCSMNPVENEAVVANILRLGQGKLVLEDCSHKLKGLNFMPGVSSWTVMDSSMEKVNGPEDVKPAQTSILHKSLFPPSEDELERFNLQKCIRIFPHLQNTGAFFVAVIKKLTPRLPHEPDEEPIHSDVEYMSGDERREKIHPKPKRRRYGFKEDPFIFLDSDDRDWKAIKEFYGFADNFPVHQLTHKCKSGNKRSIYLVSEQTRHFIVANQELPNRSEYIKVVNGGMRLFMKASMESGFRICQDGINEILPFISPDLKVPIVKKDLLELLTRKTVPFNELSASQQFTEKLRIGSCVLIYKHTNAEGDSDEESTIGASVVEMPLVAWRGERSLSLYVSNTYKVHLRSLIHCRIVSDDAVPNCNETPARPVEEDNCKKED
uniref:tRNA (cytosine(34)-C(5))-methyltransferase n=1 Tax=Aceria tosichella TaxID=561515 RepID=A0A6G1S643_9ACAR